VDEDGEAATDADCHLLWCEMGRSCWSCLPVQLPSDECQVSLPYGNRPNVGVHSWGWDGAFDKWH
jgi:hypothetical protein